jgi:hypothetical protein
VTNAYDKLPGRPDPADLVVEVPAFEDDRPQPEPAPPAAAPELVAATEFARSSHLRPADRGRPDRGARGRRDRADPAAPLTESATDM